MDFTGFEKIARHLARPLVLVGFVMTLLFGLHKLIVQSGLLSQVSASESSTIIKLILQYGFWLGLAVMVLGFGLAFFNSWTEKKTLIEAEKPIPIRIVQDEAAVSSPPPSSLPPQEFFFGRTKELASIAEAISPEARTWGALIDGPGGIGKTALAIKAGHDAPAAHFERKIFLSAKVRELTPAGEQPLDDFTSRDYQTLLADLARELDADNAAQAAPEERVKAVHHALTGQRILLVIDNVETFPETERVRLYQFLSRLPEGCKAIVTSRRRTDIDARVIRLDRLERQDAFALLDELAKDNPHLSKATAQERGDLYEITGGNPLLLRWTAGQLGRTGSRCRTVAEACAFLEAAPKGNDPLEYIFGDLVDTFTESETAVLAALALFSQPVPVEQIAAVAGIAAQAARTALDDLNSRALLVADEEGEKFLLPKLAATFIRRKRPEHVAASGERLTDRAYALILENGYQKHERFSVLEAEWPLLAAALFLFVQGENERLQRVCDALDTFFSFSGRWDDWLSLCQQGEEKALAAGDSNKASWQTYRSGFIYYWRGESAKVLESAARCAKYWEKAGAMERAFSIRLRGLGHTLEKNYPAAIAAYQESLALLKAIAPESQNVAIALNDLAAMEQLQGDFPAAERDYKEALQIAKKINDPEGVATYTGNLAELALAQEDWPQAEKLARQALALAEKIGRQELIGGFCHIIAQALAKQGKAAEGLNYARRAVDIFSYLRQQDDLEKAQAALRECGGGM
ncbi:MAG: tetratricopeptide repeat protein [Candidatus Electronema sp. VV]